MLNTTRFNIRNHQNRHEKNHDEFYHQIIKVEERDYEKKYDSILMIIDKLIKYSHILAFKKTYIAKQLEMIILNRLIQYYEILKSIISDRNKLFTFNY